MQSTIAPVQLDVAHVVVGGEIQIFSMRKLVRALLLMCLSSVVLAVYPERPIRLIVPYAPGGSSDAIVRVLAQMMVAQLGQMSDSSVIKTLLWSIKRGSYEAVPLKATQLYAQRRAEPCSILISVKLLALMVCQHQIVMQWLKLWAQWWLILPINAATNGARAMWWFGITVVRITRLRVIIRRIKIAYIGECRSITPQ